MDDRLLNSVNQKIDQVFKNMNKIQAILELFEIHSTNKDSFAYGVMVGRLYNSFYYQSRRILKRDPTEDEFFEFVNILKVNESKFFDGLKYGF